MLVLLAQIATLIAALAVCMLGWRLFVAWRQHTYRSRQSFVLLSVRVSRLNEKLPIVTEQLFSVLHGNLEELGLFDRIQGKSVDSFSFEIAHVDGQIIFYVHTPKHLQDFIEGQIYAQYPDVEIEVVDDYAATEPMSILQSTDITAAATDTTELADPETSVGQQRQFEDLDYFAHAIGVELQQSAPELYPIKRHGQFEDKMTRTAVDPLSGITSVLAKLPQANDRAMLQIVIRPLDDAWRVKATKCARILGNNIFLGIASLQSMYARAFMTRKIWPKCVFFPLYFFMWIQGLFAGSKVSAGSAVDAGRDDVLEEVSSSRHETETAASAMMDKVVKLPFEAAIRMVYVPSSPDPVVARTKIRELASSFKQFNLPHLNGFEIAQIGGRAILERYRERAIGADPMILNTEELATIYHLPNIEVKTPNIYWVTSKKLEPPVDLPDPNRQDGLTTLGKANYRGMEKLFGIRQEDRRRHVYVIGKTGMGKSTLLENMIVSDIQDGKGVAVVDPHGDLADHVLDNIPSHRTNDVVVFDPSDRDFPVAFNMLENIDPAMSSVVASGLVGIFKKLYAESWGPRLEHILRNTILSLLEYPGTTMLGIPRILVDEKFRKQVVKKVQDPVVQRFWADEFDKMQERQRTEAISPIQNKVGQFLSSPIIRNIVGQPKSMVDLRFAMDTGKIFICNLSKGRIGEDNSSLLGSMIITKFQLDAMSRSNIPEKDRVDFYLYVDEFQNFATDSFATILSEARKYRLNLTMANQYIAQMSDEVKDAVFGNVGTTMSFQVGYDDAEYVSKQFSEVALPNDLVQLPKYNLYTKLLVDGMPTQPFSAVTLPPIPSDVEPDRREKVIALSRERYAKPREMVEDKIKRWSMSSDSRDALPSKITAKPVQQSEKKEAASAPKKAVEVKAKTTTPANQPSFAPPPEDDAVVEIVTPKKADDVKASTSSEKKPAEKVDKTASDQSIPGKPLKIPGLTGFTPGKKKTMPVGNVQQTAQSNQSQMQSAQQQPATFQPSQAQPTLTPAEQQIVEQWMIHYQQQYNMPASHARQSAITAVLQQRTKQQPTQQQSQSAQSDTSQVAPAQTAVNPIFTPAKIVHNEATSKKKSAAAEGKKAPTKDNAKRPAQKASQGKPKSSYKLPAKKPTPQKKPVNTQRAPTSRKQPRPTSKKSAES